jgi:hypothetical protein
MVRVLASGVVDTVPGCVVKIYKYGMHITSAMHWLNVS